MDEFLINNLPLSLVDNEKIELYKKDKVLILLPKLPRWVIVGKDGAKAINNFLGLTLLQIEKQYGHEARAFAYNLIEAGILTFQQKKSNKNKNLSLKFPLVSVWFNVTNACQLQCKHCFVKAGHKENDELDIKEIDYIFKSISSLRGVQPVDIDITGGEPLMRPDIINILSLSKRTGLIPRLLTNGLLINEKIVSALKEFDIEVVVSLDGAQAQSHDFLRGEGTFKKTIKKIELLVNKGVRTALIMTVHHKNFVDIPDFIKIAQKLGVNRINISPLRPLGRSPTNNLIPISELKLARLLCNLAVKDKEARKLLFGSIISRYIEIVMLPIRRDYCGAGSNVCAISSIGDIYPCPSYQFPAYSIGNIRSHSLMDLWLNSSILKKFRSLSVDTMNKKCSNCSVRYFCGAGCRATAHIGHNLEMESQSPYCSEYQMLFEELIWAIDEQPELQELRTDTGLQLTSGHI